MKIDHQTDSDRWRALKAELALTRSTLAETLDRLDEATASEPSANAASVADLKSRNTSLVASNRALRDAAKSEVQEAAELRNIVDSANVATIVLDTRLKVRRFTPAITIMFQLREADIGRPLAMLTPLAPDPKLLEDARNVLRTSATSESDLTAADGRCLRRIIKPSHDENIDVDGVIVTYLDITEAQASADVLTAERDSAETKTRAKSAYLAAASHDLRQPLQAMAALHGLLAQSATDSGSAALIDRLDTSLQAIAGLLDTLLDDDRVENGTARIDIHPMTITTLFQALADAHALTAENDGTALTFVASHLSVCSDPLLLQQMLSNLIGNALRFAAHGKVLVGARPRSDHVVFEIWDNGIGIAPDQVDSIFEAYKQIVPTEASGGQGLGLSIVASLGKLLDHKVDLRSVPGSGSVFTIEVPLTNDHAVPETVMLATHKPRSHRSALQQSNQTVHIIDDDVDVRESLCELLLLNHPHVNCHASAEDFLRDWVPENAACLLVDAALPGMDGLSLLRHLKKQGIMPPSIIITGKGDYATAIAALRIGTLDFLEKPLPAKALIASVDDALQIDAASRSVEIERETAREKLSSLTNRERDVLDKVLDGHPSKNIAADLGISQRTVESHRAAMMRKTGCRSLAALVRLAIAAEPETEAPAN